MNTVGKNHLESIRRIALISLAVSIYTIIYQYPKYHGMGSLLGSYSGSRLFQISPIVIVALIDIAVLVLSYRSFKTNLLHIPSRLILALRKVPLLSWICFTLIGLVFPVLVLGSLRPDFDFMLSRLWIFCHLILIGSLFLRVVLPGYADLDIVAMTALIYALVERVALYIPDISTQITSMGWSEASRYYYASLFFSDSIYGVSAPLSSLHPSRYLLQSIPFLIPGLPIWVHRAWQVILWLVLPLMGSLLIVRRLKIRSALLRAMIVIWGYLFLNQGPVYYHLMVPVIIVAAGFSAQKPLRTLFIVLLASIWAGISRINWFPVPGILAVMFFLLEVPRSGKSFWQYWLWPVIWVLSGVFVAFISETAYIALSGTPVANFRTSFTSSLLWYRLFPNTTYPSGILNSLLLAIVPVLILIFLKYGRSRRGIHYERGLMLGAILLVFLVGGLIVSVKIGGGSNLHNMDAFLVFMLIAAVYFYFDRVKLETGVVNYSHPVHWVISFLLVFFPVINVIQVDANISRFDNKPVIQDLEKLQEIIDAIPSTDRQVLFISQRHFLTFNSIQGVTLIPEYEKVFMMEMAMAGNQAYFDQFERDLKSHRFDLIVSEPLSMTIQDEQYMFSEENNAWTTHVTALIRKYYHESMQLPNNTWIVVSEPNP
jgi:hypothetical protein